MKFPQGPSGNLSRFHEAIVVQAVEDLADDERDERDVPGIVDTPWFGHEVARAGAAQRPDSPVVAARSGACEHLEHAPAAGRFDEGRDSTPGEVAQHGDH